MINIMRVMKVFIVFCLGMALSFSAFAQSDVEEGSMTAEGSATAVESSTTVASTETAEGSATAVESSTTTGSATTGSASIDDDDVYRFAEVMPNFNGDRDIWIKENLRYPASALENDISGKVFVTFIVEKDGSVSNARVVQGIDKDLNEEAVRVVSSMPKWTPGQMGGEFVRVQFTIPVNFSFTYRPETEVAK